jgi:lysophospholipase L1-like esterase
MVSQGSVAHDADRRRESPVRPQSGPEIYLKVDFDAGDHPVTPADGVTIALTERDQALSGRSLRLAHQDSGGTLGAHVPLEVTGAAGVRVAFAFRARAMQSVTVNVFDERRQDNTTPMSPARVFDDDWHTAVLAVEGFRYNGGPPDSPIGPDTQFSSLFFHGREDGPAAELSIDKLAVYRGRDGSAPAAPADLRGVSAGSGTIGLTWQEPSDNIFAVVYSIYRRAAAGTWEKIGETLRPSFEDRPPTATAVTYRVTATDFDNNVSPPSAETTVNVPVSPARGVAAERSVWEADRLNYAENVRQVHARGEPTVRPDVFLFAGDSITAATVYTHTLGSWLGRGIAIRQGVGRVTTDYGAATIRQYLAEARPEFAIVMYGTNDLEYGRSVSAAMRQLALIVDACVEAGTIPVLATIPPRGFDKRRQRGPEDFNRALAALARQKRVPVSYVFEEMMRHELEAMLYDGVHLQPESGNDAAGRALRQTMDQVYFALRDTSGRW